MLGAFALYLQDSMMLLHYDEATFLQTRKGWTTSIGADAQLVGRHLFVPNPLTPTRAVFRTSWLDQAHAQDKEHWPALRHFLAALESLKPVCHAMFTLLFVVLPLLLWWYPHPLALLALLALMYLCASLLAWQMWRYRRVLGLDRRSVLAWGFEALACPPLAINLVRKICLHRGLHADPIRAETHLCSPIESRLLRNQIDKRLTDALSLSSEDDPHYPALHTYRQRFEGKQS
ncbi:hypothetical protein [Lysobacter sp. A421]